MDQIASVNAIEILDSRGTPTLEVVVTTKKGIVASAKVPSGASKGEKEACELRDDDKKRYLGKGVLKAEANVNGPINQLLIGQALDQKKIDTLMIEADGTENKSNFGANATVGVSLAVARAIALVHKTPLFRSIKKQNLYTLPRPMMNIINGGVHADSSLDIQEFMICPNAPSFKEALRYGVEVFWALKAILKASGYRTSVGDEGGFAPNLKSEEEAFDLICQAIEKAGFKLKEDVALAIDAAANSFYDSKTKKYIEMKKKAKGQPFKERTTDEQVDYLKKLTKQFPLISLEDGLDENDWEGWKKLTAQLPDMTIVGDDLFVTNAKILARGIKEKAANAVLIKPNQIGTLTETMQTIALALKNNYTTVISHRSGDTEDAFIADLAVATNSKFIKTGSLSRSERICKYNRLLEIENFLL